MNACETLEQRWRACREGNRDRRSSRPFSFAHPRGEQALVQCAWRCWSGLQWLEDPPLGHDRPCTSPRRRQCRAGGKPTPPQGWSPKDGWFTYPFPETP